MQIVCYSKSEHFKPFPKESRQVDCYRGLTVLTRIHEKYYPTLSADADKLVTEKVRNGKNISWLFFHSSTIKTQTSLQNPSSHWL